MNDLLQSGLWQSILAGPHLRIPEHDLPARRRHGHDRQSLRQEARRRHPLQRQGHGDPAGRQRRHRDLYGSKKGGAPRQIHAALVHLHHPGVDPQPDPDECRRADEERDRRALLRCRHQGRPAVQAPLLGRRRLHLWRHQLHRSAQSADRLSEHRLFQGRPGRAAGRLHLRHERLQAHGHVARGARRSSAGERRPDPSAVQHRVPERRGGGLASRAVDARLRSALDRRSARAALRQSVRRSTGASCWPANTPRGCPPGRKARSCRRSMRSGACISACWRARGQR